MYKAIIIDLDGTLLNDYKEIPSQNREEINKLYKRFGIIPIIATARPLGVAKYIANKGGEAFQNYIIATNGAMLEDIKNSNYLINQSLSKEQLEQLIELCEKYNLEYEAMTSKYEVADSKYSYRRCIDPMYDNMGIPFNYQSDLRKYLLTLEDPIPLFSVNGTEEELERVLSEFEKLNDIQISGQCIRTTPEVDVEGKLKSLAYYDIMKKGVTKASAIEILANHLGIKKKEIIAIGDGGNDKEMLEMAGLKIAMANATDELKEIADIVTKKDNNNGGVAEIVKQLYHQLEKSSSKRNSNKEERD